MKITNLLILIGLTALMGCIGRKLNDKPDTKDEKMTEISVHSFYCYETLTDQNNPALYIRESDSIPENSWKCWPHTFEGFEYEVGYQYRLEIAQNLEGEKPIYKLVKVISKERDPAYFRIHDIWALTHLNTAALEINENRPTAEFNLNDFTISGNASCNTYSGKLTNYSTETIEFGQLVSTKMMCPNIAIERNYLQALAKVRQYEIKGLTLFLFDASHQELLRYQKVD